MEPLVDGRFPPASAALRDFDLSGKCAALHFSVECCAAYGRALLPIQPFLDGYDRALALPMISPLLSQPLVEFGLTVPSWQWCEGGHDRALARRAFNAGLPAIVRERRTKGRVDSLFAPAYDAHRAALRRFLLDGWLASAGIIDCDAVDAALDRPADALDAVYIRLLQIADVERWVRSL